MEATLDAAVLEPTEDLDQLEGAQEQESQEEAEPELIGEKPDGRKFDKQWAEEFKNLKALYPDKAKIFDDWRDRIGRFGSISELAPKGVDDIRQWKTTIDAIGGPEKAAELMERAANIEQIDTRIAASDFSVVGELPEEMQKGFYGMLPDALNSLAESDPQKFNAAVAPHFRNALASTGLGDALKEMYTAAGDNEAVKGLIQKAFNWYKGQTEGAGEMPGGSKTVDPQVARLRAELDSRRSTDDQAFIQSTSDTAVKYKDEQFTKLSAPYIKQLGLSDAQQADLQDSFNVKIVNALAKDTAFQAQLKAYKSLKTRNPEQISEYIRANVDNYAKKTLDGIITARYGGMKARKVPPTPITQPTDGGAVRVAQAPSQDQWDMDKMDAIGYEGTVKKGLFWLKGGKSVQLVKQ